MYTASITLKRDVDALKKLLDVEEKNISRASFDVRKKGKNLLIEINADDAVALKTVMNTITKILIVWEKSDLNG